MRGLFVEQFTRSDVLTRVAPHTFKLYCTGRLNCYAAEVCFCSLKIVYNYCLMLLNKSIKKKERKKFDVFVEGDIESTSETRCDITCHFHGDNK